MSCRTKDLLNILERLAPLALQEEWDNSGLMVGDQNKILTGLYLDLDLTQETVRLAKESGVNTILTHHPLLFSPLRQVDTEQQIGRILRDLLQKDMQSIAMHTNLDHAKGGVNDALAARLGLTEVNPIPDGIGRMADVPEEEASVWIGRVASSLRTQPKFVGDTNKPIHRVGITGGAGGELIEQSRDLQLDLVITAEVKHHQALAAKEAGLFVIDAGHYETEYPVLGVLAAELEAHVDIPVFVAPFVPPFTYTQETRL